MQDEFGWKIMTKFTATWPKLYSYLDDDEDDDDDDDDDDDNICRKAKGTKKFVKEKLFMFYRYENCIYEAHDVYVKHIMYILKRLTRLH